MKRLVIVTLIGFLICSFAFTSEVKAKVFPLTSELYSLMDDLYSLQGMARPSTSRPWSQSEAKLIVSRIDKNSLGTVERSIHDRIIDIIHEGLRWDFEDFGIGLEADIALECYAHTNDKDFVLDSDWIRGFEDRLPLAKTRMDFSIEDFFYTYCDLQYGYGRVSKSDKFIGLYSGNIATEGTYGYVVPDASGVGKGYIGSYMMDDNAHMMSWSAQYSRKFATNVPPASAHFDFVWPKRALLSVGGGKWNVTYGRNRIEIGNSIMGNMLVDNHTDFEDFLSVTFYGSGFKYQMINIFLNGITNNNEVRTDDTRIFMIHSLEFRPFSNLSFIASENVMYRISSVEGASQVIDFSFFNPAYIYHNLNNRKMFNAIAYAEVNYVPLKGFEVYTQFALDQATAPNEDSSQDPAYGMVLGSKYTTTLGNGVAKLYSEFAYTSPVLYRRDEVDFVKVTRYFHLGSSDNEQPDGSLRSYGSNALVFEYIGFPYGGDAQALELGMTYSIPGLLKSKAMVRLVQHGEFNLYRSHCKEGDNNGVPNYGGSTPSGENWTRIIILSASADFDAQSCFGLKWPGVTLTAEIDWVGRWNYAKSTGKHSGEQTDTQISLGVDIKL